MNATRKNAIKNAISQDAEAAIKNRELRVRVLQKIINSIAATDNLDEWLTKPKISSVTDLRFFRSRHYLSALIDGNDHFFVNVRLSNSKDEMIAHANEEISIYLQEIERNKERLEYAEQIAERVARHVKNLKKELEGLDAMSFEHRLILSIVGLNSKV